MLTLEQWLLIVGAIVTVGTLLFAIYQWRVSRKDKQPDLVAKLYFGGFTDGPQLSEQMIFLEVANRGDKPIGIVAVELAFQRKTISFMGGIPGTHSIPFDLPAWKNARFWYPVREIRKALYGKGEKRTLKVKARFRDAIGNKYESEAKPILRN
jgi:hypothetical protein